MGHGDPPANTGSREPRRVDHMALRPEDDSMDPPRRPDPPQDRADPLIIGWREIVTLPAWGIEGLVAKADTGARSSAIDVGHLVELPGERLRFDVAVDRRDRDRWIRVECPIVRRTRVRSSFGAAHDRFVVRTTMRLGPIEKLIDLSLVSRKDMHCRMLIGRAALHPEMLVDPGHTYLLGRRRRSSRTSSTKGPAR